MPSHSRMPGTLRPTRIEPFPSAAPGSVVISMGDTRVLCTASPEKELPPFLRPKPGEKSSKGWVTAEYAMLPGSTPDRKKRGPDSRATEIQRLIGRVLRAAVQLEKMPGVCITCDCDVLCADGGTRTAAITGAYVALARCVAALRDKGLIAEDPLKGPVAAVSVGIVDGKARLDLDYSLDVKADVDMNVAMNHRGELIEVQGTGEQATFTRRELDRLLDLAAKGIKELINIQRAALRGRPSRR
jgi:ribonuclease PH